MKVVTWNINGIRAFRGGIKKALDSLDADVICIQETKVTRKWLAIAVSKTRELSSRKAPQSEWNYRKNKKLTLNFLSTGDLLDERIAIVDGYNSYFSYSRGRSGYSGSLQRYKNSFFVNEPWKLLFFLCILCIILFQLCQVSAVNSVQTYKINCTLYILLKREKSSCKTALYPIHMTCLAFLMCTGVATYCKDSATPFAAEEGLTGLLTIHKGAVGCYGDHTEFSSEELQLLDNEGRAIITQHRIKWEKMLCVKNPQFFSASGEIPVCMCVRAFLILFCFLPTDVRIKRKPLLLLTFTVRGLTLKSLSESSSNCSSTGCFRVGLKLYWKMEGKRFKASFAGWTKRCCYKEVQVCPVFTTDVSLRH